MLIPEQNRKDLAEIPAEILEVLDVKPVKWVDEVLEIALVSSPYKAALEADEDSDVKKSAVVTKEVRHH